MVSGQFSLILLTKQLVIERTFEYNGGMELGDSTSTAMDAALDALNEALDTLITTVESGGLDHLKAAEKVAVWQRFETIRNQLPLVDHRLIADAESNDLPGEYCCSTLSQFLVRVLQLSHGEAASRVRAAAAARAAHAPCWARNWSRCCRGWPLCNATAPSPPKRWRLWNGPCTNCPDPN